MTDAIISEIIKTYDEVKADEMVKYELEDTVFIRLGCYDARYFKRKNCLETKEKTKKRLEDAFYRIAVSTMSIALALPIARGRRWVPPPPGIRPSVISGWPNRAESAAITMSHIIASSQPPPSA